MMKVHAILPKEHRLRIDLTENEKEDNDPILNTRTDQLGMYFT